MNPLELRDIHLPDTSLWWPPAPGWWLLLMLVLILAAIIPWAIKRVRYKPLRLQCLRELETIRRHYHKGQSDRLVLDDVCALLRRTLISYHDRKAYAATAGKDWLEQLSQVSPPHGFSSEQLLWLAHDRYKRDCEYDVEDLLLASERWMRALPRSAADVPD